MKTKYILILQRDGNQIKEAKRTISKTSFDRLITNFNLKKIFNDDKILMFKIYNFRNKGLSFLEISKSINLGNRGTRRLYNLACYYKERRK